MKSILAIDDNVINLELLGNIIRLYYSGYQFFKAMNGADGIEIAKKELPEIILLDILMPGLNGYEVCEVLKKDTTTSNIPVLMISALGSNPAERTKGLNAGADAFISKPFTVSELQAQINVVLRIKNAEMALRRKIKQIQQYQKKLNKLNNKFTLVEELERRRIAENLHDSLGQTLSLAYLKLSAIDPDELLPKTKKSLNEISGLLNKAINESRQITYDLSPPVLHELGLISAIKWRLEQIEQMHQIETTLTGEKININLKKENTIFIYRIVNELLQNVIKHASATKITIELEQKRYKYILTVKDNGIGIKNATGKRKETGGFGLLSIKERLESLNGRLTLKSKPGIYTWATIEIPVKNN